MFAAKLALIVAKHLIDRRSARMEEMYTVVKERIKDQRILNAMGVPYPTDGRHMLSAEDYIHSVLIDNPYGYVLNKGRMVAYIYIIGRGMVRILNDFRTYTDEEVAMYVHHVRLSL